MNVIPLLQEIVERFVILNKIHSVTYQPLTPKLKESHQRMQSKTVSSFILELCCSTPVPKVVADWTIRKYQQTDPINGKFID